MESPVTEHQLHMEGDPPVAVRLRRSGGVRRISLRVSRVDGRVTLTAPPHVPMRALRAFLAERADWVRGHLSDQPPPVIVAPGTRLPVEGQAVTLSAARVRSARRDGDRLEVAGDRAGRQARVWLQALARERLGGRCDGFARDLGQRYSALVLRDTRSRWGSCSSEGRLMFSWRLIMAPPHILTYVAAHEVAHLVEMNHSAAFWAVVARLHPDYRQDRAWLRRNGAWMHRYRFEGDLAE